MNRDPAIAAQDASADVIIAQLNFLADLEYEDLVQIFAQSAQTITVPPRRTLFEQDAPVDSVYILLEGAVWQERIDTPPGQRPVRRLVRETRTPGTLLGIYDLLFAPAYRTRARTMQSCTLLRIDATALNRLIYRFPQVRQHLAPMKVISRLRTIPMLGRLEPVALGFLADAFGDTLTFAAGQDIYTLNEVEDRIFFIDQGQVRVDLADGPHWLGNGAAFGLLAHSGARTTRAMDHSAHAECNTTVFAIDHTLFVSITGLNPEQRAAEEMQRREQTIDNLVVFQRLSKDQRRRLTGFMSHYYFPANHHLIQQGEEADSLWVLLDGGHAAIHALDGHGNKMLTTITTGVTYFGETALLGQMPQDSSIEAQAGSEWLRLHWTDFRQFVDDEPGNLRRDIEVRTKRQAVVASEQQRQKYAWLQPGELLILLSRRHWIAFLRKGIPAFILFAVLLAIAIFGASIPGYQLWIAIPAGVLAIIALLAFIWGAIDYFNDWVVVTNRRVVHQEKVLFVNEWRKEAPLEQIQDVSFRTTFLGRWLNYGTMIIQTASTSGVISFDYTRHFDQLDNVIKQQRELRQRHSAAQSKLVIHRRLEERLGLNLELPSRVFRGGVKRAEVKPTGWQKRMERRSANRYRRTEGNTIVWRKHWMVLWPQLWLPFVSLVTVFVITVFLAFGVSFVPANLRFATEIIVIISVLVTIAALGRVLWVWANWRNDRYEVSDTEIVHVEKLPLALAEQRSVAGLGRIQNVEMSIPTPLHWLFNYGNVRCQTAAEYGDFIFYGVYDPRSVAAEIQLRMERYRRREEEKSARDRARELPDWFEVYNNLDTDEFASLMSGSARRASMRAPGN